MSYDTVKKWRFEKVDGGYRIFVFSHSNNIVPKTDEWGSIRNSNGGLVIPENDLIKTCGSLLDDINGGTIRTKISNFPKFFREGIKEADTIYEKLHEAIV